MDCVFCKIASGEIGATEAYRDDEMVAIVDANPQAPTHLLVIPRAHHEDVAALYDAGSGALASRLFALAAKLGRERGANGFRLVVNAGTEGGQTVSHVHVHVLAGRAMTWPPG